MANIQYDDLQYSGVQENPRIISNVVGIYMYIMHTYSVLRDTKLNSFDKKESSAGVKVLKDISVLGLKLNSFQRNIFNLNIVSSIHVHISRLVT